MYIKKHNINIHADVVSIMELLGGYTIEGRQTEGSDPDFSLLQLA